MPVIKNFKADLRSKYSRYLKISLILSLSFLILAFKLSPTPSESIFTGPTCVFPIIDLVDIPETVQKPKPPPPPDPVPADYLDEELIEEIELDDVEIDFNEQLAPPPPPPDPPVNDENEILDFLPSEDQPVPVGGISAIQEKVYYTEIGRKAEIEGTVVIEAVVNKQGNIIDAFVKKNIGGGLDEVALNAVKNTKFHPGKQRGKPVNVRISIPIKFVLK